MGNIGHGKSNPRYIPVLKALEKQSESTLPFEDRFEQAFESERIRILFQNVSTKIVQSWKARFETTYHIHLPEWCLSESVLLASTWSEQCLGRWWRHVGSLVLFVTLFKMQMSSDEIERLHACQILFMLGIDSISASEVKAPAIGHQVAFDVAA